MIIRVRWERKSKKENERGSVECGWKSSKSRGEILQPSTYHPTKD